MSQLALTRPAVQNAGMRCRRWLVIAIPILPYWTLVGQEIVTARENAGDVFAWLFVTILTLPWSIIPAFVFDPSPENERAWLTVITIGSANLNGLLYALFVLWVTRRRSNLSQASRDYLDGPLGAVRDGKDMKDGAV